MTFINSGAVAGVVGLESWRPSPLPGITPHQGECPEERRDMGREDRVQAQAIAAARSRSRDNPAQARLGIVGEVRKRLA